MNVIGKTTNDLDIVDGVFHLYSSEGIPLQILFMLLQERRMMPSWIHFYHDALENGWKHTTVLSRLKEALTDSYSRDYAMEVIRRLGEMTEWPKVPHC